MALGSRLQELTAKYMQNSRRFFVPLANEYRKSRDLDRAIALCREHLPSQPGHMSGHIVLGQAYFEKGDLTAAREVFLVSVGLDDENLIALRHLGDIARKQGDQIGARQWYARVLDADPQNVEIEALQRSMSTPVSSPAIVADDAGSFFEFVGRAEPAAVSPLDSYAPQTPSETQPVGLPQPEFAADLASDLASGLSEPTPPGLRAITDPAPVALDPSLDRGSLAALPPVKSTLEQFDFANLGSDDAPMSASDNDPFATLSETVEETIVVDDGVGFEFADLDAIVSGTHAAVEEPSVASPESFADDESAQVVISADPIITPPTTPLIDDGGLLSRPSFGALASFASWRSAQERATPVNLPAVPTPTDQRSAPQPHVTGTAASAPSVFELGAFGTPAMPMAAIPAPSVPGETPSFVPRVTPTSPAHYAFDFDESSLDTAPTAPEFVTETMAALYAQQGFNQQALTVYRELLQRSPDDSALAAKAMELEAILARETASKSLEADADKALQFDELPLLEDPNSDGASILEAMYDASPPESVADDFAAQWTPESDAAAADAGDDWFAQTDADALLGATSGSELFGVSLENFGPADDGNSDDAAALIPVKVGVALEEVFGNAIVATADQLAADMMLSLATQMVGRLPKEAPTLPVPDVLELPSAASSDGGAPKSQAPLLSFDRFFSGSGSAPRARLDTPVGVTPPFTPAAPPVTPSLSPTFGGVPVIPPPPASVTPSNWSSFDQFVPPPAREQTPPSVEVPRSFTPLPYFDAVEPERSATPPSSPPVQHIELLTPAPTPATTPAVDVAAGEPAPVADAAPLPDPAPAKAPSDFHRWLEGLS